MERKTKKINALLHFVRWQQAYPSEITALLHLAEPDQVLASRCWRAGVGGQTWQVTPGAPGASVTLTSPGAPASTSSTSTIIDIRSHSTNQLFPFPASRIKNAFPASRRMRFFMPRHRYSSSASLHSGEPSRERNQMWVNTPAGRSTSVSLGRKSDMPNTGEALRIKSARG